jgi:polyisoprenyl-phosphate glycosyltransferase
MQTVSVVVPCFNEADVRPEFFKRLSGAAATWGMACDIICVDDGLYDRTWAWLKGQPREQARAVI